MMASLASAFHTTNRLLSVLSSEDLLQLEPYLEPVVLPFRQRLESANRKIRHVYFIEGGVASIIATRPGSQAEVGLIGLEGVTGSSVVLGVERVPTDTLMQIAGAGRRIAVEDLRSVLSESKSLAAILMRYAHIVYLQAVYTALANAECAIDQRLARYLLMAHDRVEGDDLHLTHEFISIMLGVRRAGVTAALYELE